MPLGMRRVVRCGTVWAQCSTAECTSSAMQWDIWNKWKSNLNCICLVAQWKCNQLRECNCEPAGSELANLPSVTWEKTSIHFNFSHILTHMGCTWLMLGYRGTTRGLIYDKNTLKNLSQVGKHCLFEDAVLDIKQKTKHKLSCFRRNVSLCTPVQMHRSLTGNSEVEPNGSKNVAQDILWVMSAFTCTYISIKALCYCFG